MVKIRSLKIVLRLRGVLWSPAIKEGGGVMPPSTPPHKSTFLSSLLPLTYLFFFL